MKLDHSVTKNLSCRVQRENTEEVKSVIDDDEALLGERCIANCSIC